MTRVAAPSFQASVTCLSGWLSGYSIGFWHRSTVGDIPTSPCRKHGTLVYTAFCLQDVTSFLQVSSSAVKEDRALFQQSLAAFITANEDPTTSPNFKSKVTDLPGPLFQLLEQTSPHRDQDLILLLLKVQSQLLMG